MIRMEHCFIRAADPDDAYLLWEQFDFSQPHSFLLGSGREVLAPTFDEFSEMLSRRELLEGAFFVIENTEGALAGCCMLRGMKHSHGFAEIAIVLLDGADYARPIADDVFSFVKRHVFIENQLQKIQAHCLESETAYRDFLVRTGFESHGIQQEILYTNGRYFNLEAFGLLRDSVLEANQAEQSEEPADAL